MSTDTETGFKVAESKGTVATFDGEPIVPAIAFNYKHREFQSLDAVRTAGAYPSEADILSFCNTREKQNERAKGQNAALSAAGIERKTAADDGVALREMTKIYVLRGMAQDDAEVAARKALGL